MSKTDHIDIAALFGLAPEDAIRHLESQGLHIGWNWQDTLDEAHARSFTVAKMTDLGLLSDTRNAVVQAMQDGSGFQGFADRIKPKMQEKGWWGRQTLPHPHNPEYRQEVQLGSPRRLKTIYHTARRQAVAAARYQTMLQAADTHPYWQYSAVMDSRTRPHHSAMHGAVYAYDDPFWQHNYPPNGYGCRCTVKALTAERAEAHGISRSEMQPYKQYLGTDQGTGEIYSTVRYATPIPKPKGYAPYGIQRHGSFAADAGFNGSPAASHLTDQLWLEKARAALGNERALSAIAEDMASEARVRGFLAFVRTTAQTNHAQHRSYGVGLISARAMQAFQTALPAGHIGSPVAAYKDKLITGRKARRHEAAGNDLDLAAYEKIVREFARPDYELWDTRNRHLLLVFKMNDRKAVKLSVAMGKEGAEVISGFYVAEQDIKGGIAGGMYEVLK